MTNAIERGFENRRMAPFREFSEDSEPNDDQFPDSMGRGQETVDVSFCPSCEISEAGNNYVLKVDLPGVPKGQVNVEVDQDYLTVSAERREEKELDSGSKFLSEVCYGPYKRTFTLPGHVDETKVDAKLENGVLTVTVPKMTSQKGKQIPVH